MHEQISLVHFISVTEFTMKDTVSITIKTLDLSNI